MIFPIYFDPKKSLKLFNLTDNFDFLKKLYVQKKFPKVLLLSGKKGSGKSTLINHLMYFIFDKNYNDKTCELNNGSIFYNQFINDISSNIIYLSGSNYKDTKIEDIRNLKTQIFKSSISKLPRFIIFDDVDLFNNNSLNALLKIIEEPTKNNYFLLINNKSKPLIETIKSRCLEINIILNEEQKMDIISSLSKKFDINLIIDPKSSQLTPGNFIKFNYICDKNKISINDNFIENLKILLNFFKKDKNMIFIDMMLFFTDTYFNNLKNKNNISNEKIIENKRFVFENINKFFLYNLNQNAFLNNVNNKINVE